MGTRLLYGCGSKLTGGANRRFWYPCFHLPGQAILEFRFCFLSHSHKGESVVLESDLPQWLGVPFGFPWQPREKKQGKKVDPQHKTDPYDPYGDLKSWTHLQSGCMNPPRIWMSTRGSGTGRDFSDGVRFRFHSKPPQKGVLEEKHTPHMGAWIASCSLFP